MDSKSAVNAVLNHQKPDHIPLGTYAIDHDTVEKILGHETYVRNKVKIQLALWEGRRDEVAQSLKEDSVELFKKLDCIDVIIPCKEAPLLPPKDYIPTKVRKLDDSTWVDERGLVYKYSYSTNDIAVISNPIEYKIEDFQGEPQCTAPDETIFEAYDHLAGHMGKERFLAGISGGFNPMLLLGCMERGLMEYCMNPELVLAALQYYAKIQNFLDGYYIREGIDQVFIEDDFAMTNGPLLSPEMFEKICLPVMRERICNIRKYREKVMLHCCGNTWKLMDMIIDAGVDGYQSLQTGAGMNIRELKEKYGSKLCFWGGVSVEKLIEGSPEEVREDVRYAMKYGSPDGGFILGPSHSIAYGVKYDNFMAMLDEYDKLKYNT